MNTASCFKGELAELYANACACASKEAELVIACFVYRVRHATQPRLQVSKDVVAALKAAGCLSRKKISACSLGMFVCQQVDGIDDYFEQWSHGLSFKGDGDSYRGYVQAVVSVLQARHLERVRGQKGNNLNPGLSLRRLYEIFRKWTNRSNDGTITACRPVTGGGNDDKQPPRASEQPLLGDSNRSSDNSKRKRQLSSEAEVSSSTSTSTTVTNEEDEDEEEEEENEQVTDAIERVVNNAHKRRRLSASNAPRHTLTKEKTPRLQLRSYPSTTTQTRGHVPQRTQRTTTPVTANHSATSDDEEKEEEDEEETESEEEAQQQPALKNKQKLRTPFRPPQHLRNKPCVSRDGGKTWTSIPWNKKHALPGGDAWIQPVKEFFRSTRELESLKEEDRKHVSWRQDFEYCYGVHWPVRHLGAFMASEEVEASVSHRDTSKEGRHLVLDKSGDIKEFPSRKALVERLNKEWASELGKGNVFNAVQSNLYSGSLVLPDGVSSSSSPDHISFHKDGRCKKRGPPIVSGCYSNVVSSEQQEDLVAAFLIHSEDPDKGLRVWIPQVSGTGYAFGGKHCHKRYYHGKFLWGDWRAYLHHVSITFSCYHSWKKSGNATHHPGQQQHQRGVAVSVDWNLTGGARLWSRRYLLGQVPKSACHPDVLLLNDDRIVTSNYGSVWGPWDEFKNTSILQLLQLHPADGGQGIAGNRDHALSLLVMGEERYPNRVLVHEDSCTLRVEYYASDKGKMLLKRAKRDRILVRVFLSPAVPARASLFVGSPAALLFLPLMIVESKGKDAGGVFFVLSARLSSHYRYKLKRI